MSYSDVALVVGRGGPRQVGQALSRFGSGVPWWRVLRADGTCAPLLAAEQRNRLAKERTPFDGGAIDLKRARWRPDSAVSRSVGTG
jgi:alkylated DNA nucleotide flippase Atl1